jgi:hypothetical protein
VRATGAVIAHLDDEAVVVEGHLDVDDARVRVSSRVGQGFADQEVGRGLHLGSESPVERDVKAHEHR